MASTVFGKVIDADGHIFEDDAAIIKRLPSSWGFSRPSPLGFWPPLDNLHGGLGTNTIRGAFTNPGLEGWSRFMEDVGVEMSVLYPSVALSYGRFVDPDKAIGVGIAYNDWLHETYLTKNPRFRGMALIPMQDPEAAVGELRRAVQELGMCGAVVMSNGLKSLLGSKEYWPVYQEADRLGCCIAVHGGCHGNLGLDDLKLNAPIHALGHPFGITISFVSMLFNGIFDKFPRARFAFLESGVAWFLLAMERCTTSYKGHTPLNPRGEYVRFQPDETVADYILRQVQAGRLFVGVEGDEPDLPYAVAKVGNGPFMYSSDFPHEVNTETCREALAEIVENEELSQEDKAAILHGNAERFYKLNGK